MSWLLNGMLGQGSTLAPSAPTGLTAVATGPQSVFVDWDNVSGADTYKLERRTGTSGSFTQIYSSSISQYTDSGNHLNPNTTYQYRVRATNETGDSAYSSTITVTTQQSASTGGTGGTGGTIAPYITLNHQLEVIPTRKVLVPGCEPTSALSSTKLSSWLAEAGCGNALVDLDVALEAIPGSYVKLGNNFGRGNMRQKWFVLPGIDLDCPCQSYDDYYRILRDLASEEDEDIETFDSCDVIGMGYCPSPDFDQTLPPPPDPYQEEGEFPGDVGVLPPIPPWSQAGT